MMSAANLRKGWCPGALRPMRSGDGLLVRVRPRAGAFSIAAFRTIGEIASGYGSGAIDLTNRGNLQIRGVTDEALESALLALEAADLLDASAEAEAVRNVVVDPLSVLDPGRADVRDLAALTEDFLRGDHRLWSLPSKFCFGFSGTGDPRIGETTADIMISADDGGLAICLDGATDVAVALPRDEVVEAAQHLALAFVELNTNDASFRRMREVVGRLGAATVFAMAGLPIPLPMSAPRDEHAMPVGLLTRNETAFGVGIGLPFGRIDADQLRVLCNAAVASDALVIHTGPQRVLVFPLRDGSQGARLLRVADDMRLIVDAADIRLAMDVCPGAPACGSARADTRDDAQHFADTFSGSLEGRSIHISGCEKGCARRSAASFTLVGRGGYYDIIRDGCASAANGEGTVEAGDIGAAISRRLAEPTT